MVRPGNFRMKRMALMAGVIGGVALLLAACGGGSGSDQVSNITTSTPTPPSAKCPVPGEIPEVLRQWAEMCDEWDPVRIDPQLLGAFNTGVLTRQDVEAIARTLKDLEIAKRLAMLTLDLSWLEKMDVVTDARMKVVRERIWPLLVESDKRDPACRGRSVQPYHRIAPAERPGSCGCGGALSDRCKRHRREHHDRRQDHPEEAHPGGECYPHQG